jgi:RNA polymerase sigma-70 factor, ECF subfamily
VGDELTTSFMEQTVSPTQSGSAELATFLRGAHARALERWPGIALSPADFAAHLGAIAPDEGDLVAALQHVHCDDLFLACACGRGDKVALRVFESEVMPRAAMAVARVDGAPQFVDDICGDVRVRLLVSGERPPEILRYLGRGPLSHWVQVVAMRMGTASKRKKRHEIAMDLPQVVDSILGEDPEIAPFASQLRQPFAEVFAAALADLSRRERNILRLYLIDGVSAETIGKMYNVHRATVARWITKAREKVHSLTRRRLSAAVKLDETSFESVVGMMWSGIDLSLATFLGGDDDTEE